MKMCNFKVGDIVRGISDNYCITDKNMTKGEVAKVYKVSGKVEIKILEHKTRQNVIGKEYTGCSKDFELISPKKKETIVIYRKDEKTVVALDKSTGEKVEAFCHPDDTFDFREGAKVAFERLMGNEKVKEKGKVETLEGYTIIKYRNYEVGDKILLVDKWTKGCYQNSNGGMDEWLGKVVTINSLGCDISGKYCKIKEDGEKWYWYFNAIAGKLIKEVKRQAKVGEYIKIVNPFLTDDKYKEGDIFKIRRACGDDVLVEGHNVLIKFSEYVVLEGYKAEKVFKPYLKLSTKNCGYIGTPTDLKDVLGRKLYVGDTVEVYSIQQDGAETKVINQGEKVVVCDIIAGKFFITGYRGSIFIKNGVLYVAAFTATYKILRKRNYQEISDGETIDGITCIKTER